MDFPELTFLLLLGSAAALLAGAPTLCGLLLFGFAASFLTALVQANLWWWSLSPEERRAEREQDGQDTDWSAW